MNPPEDVTVTIASSPSSARRFGSGRSTARSASMRLRLRALRRPTSASMKARVLGDRVEVARAAQQQRVPDRALEMAVRRLDGSVLVGDPAIVAAGGHAVVAAQRIVTDGPVLLDFRGHVAAGHGRSSETEKTPAYPDIPRPAAIPPARPTSRPTDAPAPVADLPSGYALPWVRHRRRSLILIVAPVAS